MNLAPTCAHGLECQHPSPEDITNHKPKSEREMCVAICDEVISSTTALLQADAPAAVSAPRHCVDLELEFINNCVRCMAMSLVRCRDLRLN